MTTANTQPEQPTVLDVLQASPAGPVLDMPVPRTPLEALEASPLGPWLDTPFTDMAAGALPALPQLPPLPGVDDLLRPISDLAAAFGTGTFGSLDPTALLRQSSSVLDTALSMGASGLRALDGVWDGGAATAAQEQGGRTQAAGEQLSVRGNEIAAVTQEAAGTVARGNAELVAVAESFVATAAAAAPVALTPPGQTMIIAAAADHLQRALSVVAETRAELAGHQAAMATLGTAIPVPPAPVPAPGLAAGGGPSPITIAASLLEAVGRPFTEPGAGDAPAQTHTAGVAAGPGSEWSTRPAAAGASPTAASAASAASAGTGWLGAVGGPPAGTRGTGPSAAQLSADAAGPGTQGSRSAGGTAAATPPGGGLGGPGMMSPTARPGYDDTVDRSAPSFLVDAGPHNTVVGELPLVAPAVLGGVDPDDLAFED
ncbi:hypothetical protein [Rhodococcus sp. SGAir0479]|uniref:hypothetical protein n=1 Tax=Rhodococcus sp. SGAir0479 TaxID=2567884 RepID=UPI0010CD1372|nr:hypothetical protein [Rhodococcus sp. SGAir0479]QCQ90899.1 hypothetical protein E7742_06350 [Rhodococcus sp. SGAir0479]